MANNEETTAPEVSSAMIVPFPADKIVRYDDRLGPVHNMDEVKAHLEEIHSIHIQTLLDGICTTVATQLAMTGFLGDVDNGDMSFVAETIRALMSRKYNIEHSLHNVMTDAMIQDDDGIWWLNGEKCIAAFDESDLEDEVIEVELEDTAEASV